MVHSISGLVATHTVCAIGALLIGEPPGVEQAVSLRRHRKLKHDALLLSSDANLI